jgi:hypothetical protein
MATCEAEVREAVLRQVAGAYRKDRNTIVVAELGLCRGSARIDLAVVDGSLDGYEIKSERDTLRRLPAQVRTYGRVLDRVTIVCGRRHVDSVAALVPPWWGITKAMGTSAAVELQRLRAPAANPSVDPSAVVQLLWRDELLAEAYELHGPRGLSRRTRYQLGELLVRELPVEALGRRVRDRLRARRGWRARVPPA